MIRDWKWMHSVADRECTQLVSVVRVFPIASGCKNFWRNYQRSPIEGEMLVSFVVSPWLAGNWRPMRESRDCLLSPKRSAKDRSLFEHKEQMGLDLTLFLSRKVILQHLPSYLSRSKPKSVIALRRLRPFGRFLVTRYLKLDR